MNPPLHTSWSVVPWGRYDADPPDFPPRTLTTPDGHRWEVREPMDPAWHANHWCEGVQIHDHDRGVTYRATVDDRGRLDHLEVICSEGAAIDENVTRRVPVDRIRRVARVHVNAQRNAGPDEIVFTLPGGVRFNPGRLTPDHRGDKPPLEELADRMIRLGEGRQELAAHYGRKVRTVDGWVRQAREHGFIPETRRELRAMQEAAREDHQTPDGGQPSEDHHNK